MDHLQWENISVCDEISGYNTCNRIGEKKFILDTVDGMEEHTVVEIRGRRTTSAETNTVVAVR